jgi:hypothetical protein
MSAVCRCVSLLNPSDLLLTNVQSFHTPTTLRDFYRYIRIDFHSHYGREYYCPVSLLRVYGLTHLEQWKWDTWEAESRSRAHAQAKEFSPVTEPLPISSAASELNKFMDELQARDIPPTYHLGATAPTTTAQSPAHTSLNHSQATDAAIPMSSSISSFPSQVHGSQSASSPPIITPDVTNSASMQQPAISASSPSESSEARAMSSLDSAISSIASALSYESPSTPSDLTSSEAPYTSNIQISLSQSTSLSNHTPATNTASTAHPTFSNLPPVGSGGESIYRTIMTRLTLLEGNHSLYARYVEEQTSGVRDVLKRLGEDIGRLESIVSDTRNAFTEVTHVFSESHTSTDVSAHSARVGKTATPSGV